ncbi:hypothetical protein WPS_12250 [Vulcanimicrobium alpinum]|uniref:Zinc-binding domain-containing protein n=1 Tax=Vulcanimicrobium alpinum TaxID=3016050 RepID=A0AAN1XVV7_UNVUL|nr:hypothetical protein WPS_12250 [Vulcanimicrobium alpinum]
MLPYTPPYDAALGGAVFLIRYPGGPGRLTVRPRSVYQNRVLTCKDCGNTFDFTVRDQMFYAEKGFENEPQRCRDCRAARKSQRTNGMGVPSSTAGLREMFDAVCAQCNAETTVPFRPRGDRPVYCRNCYSAMNAVRA